MTRRPDVRPLIAFMLLLSLAGCGQRQPYSTSSIKTALGNVKTQKLRVISFSTDPELSAGSVLTETKEWERSIAETLTKSYFQNLIVHFERSHFTLINTDYETVKGRIAITDKPTIAAALSRAGADIGLLAHSQFGWSWGTARTGISTYGVDTRVSLVNRNGELIWDFDSSAAISPSLRHRFTVQHILSGISGMTPSDGTILADYADFFRYYPAVITGLIDEDIAGRQHRSKFADYVGEGDLNCTIWLYRK